ncbi:MAG: hypothetical protein IPK13_28100 [Deltaproteobacteria bacterium]|nr:hypothetical protein [Deltaproteobacteria bacterium]
MTPAAGGALASLQVNMELFASGLGPCGVFTCCAPGDPVEQAQREADYKTAGVPIGASFELRYWYLSLYGPTGQECNQPEVCNGVDDDCDRRRSGRGRDRSRTTG